MISDDARRCLDSILNDLAIAEARWFEISWSDLGHIEGKLTVLRVLLPPPEWNPVAEAVMNAINNAMGATTDEVGPDPGEWLLILGELVRYFASNVNACDQPPCPIS